MSGVQIVILGHRGPQRYQRATENETNINLCITLLFSVVLVACRIIIQINGNKD
jgi:hypothetical protein